MPARGLPVTDDDGQVALAALTQALARIEQMLGVEAGLDALGQFHLVLGGY